MSSVTWHHVALNVPSFHGISFVPSHSSVLQCKVWHAYLMVTHEVFSSVCLHIKQSKYRYFYETLVSIFVSTVE